MTLQFNLDDTEIAHTRTTYEGVDVCPRLPWVLLPHPLHHIFTSRRNLRGSSWNAGIFGRVRGCLVLMLLVTAFRCYSEPVG